MSTDESGKTNYKCRGSIDDGSPCGNRTKNPDGYCFKHRTEVDLLYTQSLLHCDSCSIPDCVKRDEAPNGVCYLELQDPRIRPNNLEEVIANLMSAIEETTLVRRRLARQAAAHPYNTKLASAFTQVVKTCQDLQDKLVTYRGWATKKENHRAEGKAKRMQKAMLAGVDDEGSIVDQVNPEEPEPIEEDVQ